MAISFTCDFCARKYRVDDGLAGRKVKCKECGTELSVPGQSGVGSGSRSIPVAAQTLTAPSSRPKPPAHDLYGLDEEAEASLPPPRRAGLDAPGSKQKGRSIGSGDNNEHHLGRNGWGLVVGGIILFVLPFFGIVLGKRNVALDPEAQKVMGGGFFLLGCAMLLAHYVAGLDGSHGLGRTTFRVFYGVVLLFSLGCAVIGVHNKVKPNPNGVGNAFAPANNNNPNFGANGFAPPNNNPANFAPQNFAPPPPPNFGQPGGGTPQVGIHITLSNGKFSPNQGPGGMNMLGLSFQVDYQMQGVRPPGVAKYQWVIQSTNGRKRATDPFVQVQGSGTLSGSSMGLNQADGPFETYLEAQTMGPGGFGNQKVSNSVPLSFEQPQPQQDPFQHRPGNVGPPGGFPQPPQFGPPGGRPGGQPPMPRGPRFGRPR